MKILIALTALVLVACGSDEKPHQTLSDKEELIIQPQIDSLEKSKQVEGVLQQAEQERRRAIEEQGY